MSQKTYLGDRSGVVYLFVCALTKGTNGFLLIDNKLDSEFREKSDCRDNIMVIQYDMIFIYKHTNHSDRYHDEVDQENMMYFLCVEVCLF